MEKKTIEQVFDEYAKELEYKDWQSIINDNELFKWEIDKLIKNAIDRFVKHREEIAVEKTLEIVADDLDGDGCYDYGSMCDIEVKRSNVISLKQTVLTQLNNKENGEHIKK